MQTRKQALQEALGNITAGTSKAVRLKGAAQSQEVRELASAVHFIGFGAEQVVRALTEVHLDDLGKKR